MDQDRLHASFAGPGRAIVRFYCKDRPTVYDAGTIVVFDWDSVTGIGRTEITRDISEAEFVIKMEKSV